MADQSIAMEDFTPQEHQNVIEWLKDSNDLDPGHVFNALGQAPGYGGWKKKAELEPGFLDELGLQFGIKTQKVKERERLQQTQEQLKPFVSALLSLKAQRLEAERYMPQNTGQAQDVLRTLGINQGGEPQPFGQQPSAGLQPAPSMGDPAMSGMPLGASSAQAAAMPQIGPPDDPRAQPLSDGGRFMTPDAAMTTPIPLGPQAQQFDYQGRPIPPTAQPDLIPQPIRAEPIAAPMQRQAPTRPAVRNLEPFEMKAASDMLHAKATGQVLPDENGILRPASMVSGENRMLKAPDIQAAARLYNIEGLDVAPGSRLPVGIVQNAFTQRLKTTHENMPEIVKLQNQADKLPQGSERRVELESRIDRLKTNGQANIGEIAAAQQEFAALPNHLQTSQNAALIAKQHKDVLTEDVMKGIKNPNQPLVNVNTGVTASEEAAKEFMKSTRATYDQLKSAPTVLANIETAKALIPSAKGFMGPGGETLLDVAKFLNNRLGTKIDTAGVKDAEELRSRIFFNIMDSLKKMDAQPSEMQQRVMMDSLGKLGTDPNALSNVLDAFADSVRGKVDAHNAEVSSAETKGTRFPYNPLIKLPPKKQATPPPSGVTEAYKDPDKEARYQEWKRKQAK